MKIKSVILLMITLAMFSLTNSDSNNEEEDKDPFDMKVNSKTTEVMRLFKINAAGLLPQIFQRIPEETGFNQGKPNDNLKKRLNQHALNWNM